MLQEWTEVLKDCLLDPNDLKEDNSFEIFKTLYENTKDISPNFALLCAREAIIEAGKVKKDPDWASHFNLNVSFFKTKSVRFIQEQLGKPFPK